MLDHYIQRAIVYKLALSNDLRFSELKPDELESKLFTYHLKKVVAAKLVEKTADGMYSLTPAGRKLGVHVLDARLAFANQARPVLLLAVRAEGSGEWLLYRRRNHPLRGRVGFMHADPIAGEPISKTAQRALHHKTGLSGGFVVAGSGYITVREKGELESFTAYTLLSCVNATGELRVDDEYADYFWDSAPNFSGQDMLPNMALLAANLRDTSIFYAEATLDL